MAIQGVEQIAQVLPFRTVASKYDAVKLMREWWAHAQRFENLYKLARIQADMSEALLRDALAECERLRGIIGDG